MFAKADNFLHHGEPVSITYPIDLAKLNASIAGKILRPFGRTSWSKSWLGDIPKELRLMVYEEYFREYTATIHASPNPEYIYESGKTNCDLIFPDCPKSSAKKTIDEVRRSHQNLFFVCSGVKDEAYKIHPRHAMFWIRPDTCTMRANFLHYEPITKLVWGIDLVSNSEAIPKVEAFSTAFPSKEKLRVLAVLCMLSAATKDFSTQGVQIFAKSLPRLKTFDAHHVFIVVDMPRIRQKGEVPCCVSIAPVNSKKDPSVSYEVQGTIDKKGFFEGIVITAPVLKHAMIARDPFVIDAILAEVKRRTSRIVIFDIFTSFVQGKQGREERTERETQRFDFVLKPSVRSVSTQD